MDSLLQDLHESLDRWMERVLEKAGVNSAPVDAEQLARQRIWESYGLAAPKNYRKPPPATFDTLEPDAPLVRRQWQAAQYLGCVFQEEARRLWQENQGEEQISGISWINLLAQRFLVPTGWFQLACQELDFDLMEIKKRFRTAPYEILALRFLDLPRVCVVTIVDNSHVGKRKSNGYRPGKNLQAAEVEALAYTQEYSRPKEVSKKGWVARCWPVHSLDWKREILLSWPPEEENLEETG